MSDADKQDVDIIQPDKDGKYPETIPWDKYVGIKEAWGRSKEKAASLEEQLRNSPNADEHNRIKQELDELRTKHQQASDELKSIQDKSASEKREALKAKGIPEEDLTDMSEKEMDSVLKVVGKVKPAPDLGSGGGNQPLTGLSPMELARRAYTR